jgi:hypothetical protein
MEFVEKLAIRIRKELIAVKSKTNGVILDPLLLAKLVPLALLNVVTELVIGHYESI